MGPFSQPPTMPTLRHLHSCRAVPLVSISAAEAALLVDLLRPRAALLTELLEVQVQHCPAGCSDWADTADALALAQATLIKLQNAAMQGQALLEAA